MKDELTQRLNALALKVSRPFCYSCYEDALSGRCQRCGSDDLMRHLPGVGCEYGTDWIIPELLHELDAVDLNERFEESIRSCYPEEVKIGWIIVDTVSAIKEMDPISWDIAQSEWTASEDGETLVSFDNGSTYFDISKVEEYVSNRESDEKSV